MTRLPVRLMLLLACVAAVGYTAFLTWSSEQRARLTDDSYRRFDTDARAAALGASELRGAQQAYVAVGQGEDFWFARASALLKELDEKLASLRSLATAPETVAALDDAAGALQDFEQMDKRARDYARSRQLTLASDLVFTDGYDLTRKTSDALARAVTAEQIARDATTGATRRKEALALGGLALGIVLVLASLVPVPRRPAHEKDDVLAGLAALTAKPRVTAPRLKDAPKPGRSPDLGDLTPAAAPPAPPAPPALPAALAPLAPPPPLATLPQEPRLDLGGMAALCVDLARVQHTRALPALLERAAEVLKASGIVLWIADPDGRELTPIVVHGYPPQLAARFGTIARDAENVTASAYRTALLQTMKRDAVSNGAVAAPLVTAGGCVGVMAAEMKDGGERLETLLAAATIIASQLATLVGPPSARAKTEAVG